MRTSQNKSYDSVKRVLDILAASVGLIVLSPVFAVVAVSVAANLGRPVLFKQDRPGRNGRVFRLYKFRTMKNIDQVRSLVTDGQRLTEFGRVLRSTSLDELPTLINVFKGDMSIVGPRPLLVQYLDRYTPLQARRHEVRPGITGLAQVSGRNALSWEEKFALDINYVDNHSISLDLRIVAATFLSVVKRDGISSEGHATANEFTGISDEKSVGQ